MHQIFPADGELRHRGVMTEVGKMANYIVMDFGSGLFAAHDMGSLRNASHRIVADRVSG